MKYIIRLNTLTPVYVHKHEMITIRQSKATRFATRRAAELLIEMLQEDQPAEDRDPNWFIIEEITA